MKRLAVKVDDDEVERLTKARQNGDERLQDVEVRMKLIEVFQELEARCQPLVKYNTGIGIGHSSSFGCPCCSGVIYGEIGRITACPICGAILGMGSNGERMYILVWPDEFRATAARMKHMEESRHGRDLSRLTLPPKKEDEKLYTSQDCYHCTTTYGSDECLKRINCKGERFQGKPKTNDTSDTVKCPACGNVNYPPFDTNEDTMCLSCGANIHLPKTKTKPQKKPVTKKPVAKKPVAKPAEEE